MTLFQRCGVTPSNRNRWNKSVRRGLIYFEVERFLCVISYHDHPE